MENQDKIKKAIEKTEVLRHPEELISTFGSTTVNFYILTPPMYLEFEGKPEDSETVVREGKITWQKPKLLTPNYMLRMEGFSAEAKEAFEYLATEDSNLAMLLYNMSFKRDSEKMEIVSGSVISIASKIEKKIDEKKDKFTAIIKGVDEYWDVSLSKFIQELIFKSAFYSQLPDYTRRNALSLNDMGQTILSKDYEGIPVAARADIEEMFRLVEKGELDPKVLKKELDRWDVFNLYQDRFLSFFKRR